MTFIFRIPDNGYMIFLHKLKKASSLKSQVFCTIYVRDRAVVIFLPCHTGQKAIYLIHCSMHVNKEEQITDDSYLVDEATQ